MAVLRKSATVTAAVDLARAQSLFLRMVQLNVANGVLPRVTMAGGR